MRLLFTKQKDVLEGPLGGGLELGFERLQRDLLPDDQAGRQIFCALYRKT